MINVSLPRYVRYCFDDRYEMCRELGIVDDKTVKVDHDRFREYVANNLPANKINKKLGVPQGTVTVLKNLERKLVMIEKQGMPEAEVSESAPADEYTAVPSIDDDFVPQESVPVVAVEGPEDGPSEVPEESVPVPCAPAIPLAVIIDGTDGRQSAMRAAIGRVWCNLSGIQVGAAVTRATVGGEGDSFYDNLNRIDPEDPHTLVPKGYTGFSHVVVWSLSELPDVTHSCLTAYCAPRNITIVEIAAVGSGWNDLMRGMEDAEMVRGWCMFAWAHERDIVRTCARSVRCELEDVMDMSRAHIPIRIIAKAYDVAPIYIRRALTREAMYDQYMANYNSGSVVGSDASEDPVRVTEQVCETARCAFETASEPVSQHGSEHSDAVETAPVHEPVADGADGFEDDLPDSERRFTAVIDSEEPEQEPDSEPEPQEEPEPEPRPPSAPAVGAVTMEIDVPMMTVSGAKSVVETVMHGAAPDMDLWTLTEDGLAVDTYRLSLRYENGRVRHVNSHVTDVVKAVYTKAREDVLVDRSGRIYVMDGFLTIRLSDYSALEVPVLSDLPLNTKRWIA